MLCVTGLHRISYMFDKDKFAVFCGGILLKCSRGFLLQHSSDLKHASKINQDCLKSKKQQAVLPWRLSLRSHQKSSLALCVSLVYHGVSFRTYFKDD